MPILSIQNMSY